jgi:asparagine synthetase B (glutamine-hydrolysing)
VIPTSPTRFGDFTFFGYTRDREGFVGQRVPARLGVVPRTIDLGTAGQVFFYTSYADVAESEESVALKLGIARSGSMVPLSSSELLRRGILQSDGIDSGQLVGSASTICLSKNEPAFAVYQTLLSVSQIYYATFDGGIVCADSLRILVRLLDHIAMNEEAIPMHFMFRLVPGYLTYFDGVYGLYPGQSLIWNDGNLRVNLVSDLRSKANGAYLRKADSKASLMLFDSLKQVLRTYVDSAQGTGRQYATLLSGGVDSSLIQLALNELALSEQSPSVGRPSSFSYSVLTAGFEAETAYADQARRSLGTDHTVVKISPDEYLDLLVKTVDTVHHPSLCVETDPCMLALAEYLSANEPDVRFCLVGHGADALFGLRLARKLLILQLIQKTPGAGLLLPGLSRLIQSFLPKKAHGLREVADMLSALQNPDDFKNPANIVAVHTDVEMTRRCFGDAVLSRVLRYRRDFAAQYLDSTHHMEQTHTIDLLTWDYESAVFGSQLFLAYQKEKWYPFLDEDFIRLAYTFDPAVRYMKGANTKALLKQILVQRSLPAIARNPKRGGTFEEDLFVWMKQGPLRDRVQSIRRPGFLSKRDFQQLKDHPSPFLWELLVFDIFRERIFASHNKMVHETSALTDPGATMTASI